MAMTPVRKRWLTRLNAEFELFSEPDSVGVRLKFNSFLELLVRSYCVLVAGEHGDRALPQNLGHLVYRLRHRRFRRALLRAVNGSGCAARRVEDARQCLIFLNELAAAQNADLPLSTPSLDQLADQIYAELGFMGGPARKRVRVMLANLWRRTEFDPRQLYWLPEFGTEKEEDWGATATSSDQDEVALRQCVQERVELFAACLPLTSLRHITADGGMQFECRLRPAALWLCYIPLCEWLVNAMRRSGRRIVVGVVGPGGSGKSTFSALLQLILTRYIGALKRPEAEHARSSSSSPADDSDSKVSPSLDTFIDGAPAVDAERCGVFSFSMDAYHLHNSYLDSRGLRGRKGAPLTFDLAAFASDLDRLRAVPLQTVPLPVYDRKVTHNPVSDATACTVGDRIVLVDGLWLLHDDQTAVRRRLDLTLYLDVEEPLRRRRVLARKQRGGVSLADAEAHYMRTDLPSAQLVARTRRYATIALQMEGPDNEVVAAAFPFLDHDEEVGNESGRGHDHADAEPSPAASRALPTTTPVKLFLAASPPTSPPASPRTSTTASSSSSSPSSSTTTSSSSSYASSVSVTPAKSWFSMFQ